MKIGNIYTGCTKDGRARIFYEMLIWDGRRTNYVYKDIKTKEEFFWYDIKSETLVPFKSRIYDKDTATRRKVLKVYYANRRLMFHVDNIFIGNISKVEWVSDIVEDEKKHMSVKIVDKDRVFIKIDDSEYIDLVTNKHYKSIGEFGLTEGDLCVSHIRTSKELKLNNELVSKDYVLKKSYNKFKK